MILGHESADVSERRLPSLPALRAFEAAARNGSFTRAARELGVTQSAVSRQIARLEADLGVRLFWRRTRAIGLTTEGLAYFNAVRRAFDQIHDATVQFTSVADDRILRIKVPPTFAIRWLVPRLVRFHARHPQIDVQITTSHHPPDFERENVDAAVVWSVAPRPGWHADRLLGEVLLPACSPKLLRGARPIRLLGDLARHTLLHSVQRPDDWRLWLEPAGATGLDWHGGRRFESSALMYQAAIDQLGVAIAQLAFIEDDLATSRLAAPFDLTVATERAYYLVVPGERASLPKVAACRAWLLEEVRERPGLQPALLALPARDAGA
jgi:LysR family glycine cleavage system transcriptional activator